MKLKWKKNAKQLRCTAKNINSHFFLLLCSQVRCKKLTPTCTYCRSLRKCRRCAEERRQTLCIRWRKIIKCKFTAFTHNLIKALTSFSLIYLKTFHFLTVAIATATVRYDTQKQRATTTPLTTFQDVSVKVREGVSVMVTTMMIFIFILLLLLLLSLRAPSGVCFAYFARIHYVLICARGLCCV